MTPKPERIALAFEGPQGTPAFVFKSNPAELFRGPERVELQRRSLELLRFFLENPETTWDTEAVLEEVWGRDSEVGVDNVTTHVRLLRNNIGAWCIERPKGGGYRLGPSVVSRPASEAELQQTRPSRRARGALALGADPGNPPYIGPPPFTADKAHLFFGRDQECQQLLEWFVQGEKRVVLVHSPSGAGKTSLINTALRAALISHRFEVLPVARVGMHLERLPARQPEKSVNLYTASAIASMGEDSGRDGAAISNWTRYFASRNRPQGGSVLIVDQMEEILTRPLGPPVQKREFFGQLREALQAFPDLRVLLAFRREYLSELTREADDLSPYWTLFRLDPLTREQARAAIVRPADEAFGVGFDSQVVNDLVDELARQRYKDGVGQQYNVVGNSVEPLQLQVVCEALWRRLPTTHVDRITWREIDLALPPPVRGGVVREKDAVAKFVGYVLDDFCGRANDEIAKAENFPVELIDLGCQQFVTQRGVRLLVFDDGEYTGSLPNRIVEALARRHLLRMEERHGERAFELAHDTLIEPIRGRAETVDGRRLEALWLDVLGEMAGSEWARSEGRDREILIEQCFREFVGEGGSPPIAADGPGRERLASPIVDRLIERGLVRRAAEGFALSNARLSPALLQVRMAAKERDLPRATALMQIAFVSVTAVAITALVTMLTRAVIAGCRLTLTQAPDVGVFAGWFHGVVGALIWAVFIAPALCRRWYVIDRCRPGTRYAWLRWGVAGAAAGLLGGLFNTVALMLAQRPDTLKAAGWIVGNSLLSAFTRTGYGWTMVIFGPAVGWACGVATSRVLASREWKVFVSRPKPASMSRTGRVWVKALFLAFKQSGIIFASMAAASALFYSLASALSKQPRR